MTNPSASLDLVYLRVNEKYLLRFPTSTADQPNPQPLAPLPTNKNLNVIAASRTDLQPYTGGKVDWLIKVARLIFEPLGTSSLYTSTDKDVEWWLNREMDQDSWRKVEEGEQLMATIYEFRPDDNRPIQPTKFGRRQPRSATTETSEPQADNFRNTILRRQPACVISGQSLELMLNASRLIPRRIGDAGVQSVCQRFIHGAVHPQNRHDPLLGVPLFSALDHHVRLYKIGFWRCGNNQYVIHNFATLPLTILGSEPAYELPLCHGHHITLSSHDPSLDLPPEGVFNWHYVQCVLKKFATDDYRAIANINCFEFPFYSTAEDIACDIDFDDPRNIENPPYPSFLLDLRSFKASQLLGEQERRDAVMKWRSDGNIL